MNTGLDLQRNVIEMLIGLGLPAGVAKLIWLPLPMVLMLVMATLFALVSTWLERKISAAAQQRIGPDYMGPFGLLVPIADVLKLLVKEASNPHKSDPWLFVLAPLLIFIPAFMSYSIVPFGQHLIITNIGIGIFLWISLSSIAPIGLLMAGYASNNKYSLLGGSPIH